MAGPEATAHERARGVVAAAFPARCDLSCRNCLSAGGPKYEVLYRDSMGSRGQMWGVVHDGPKVVRHNKDWATFS